LDGEMVLKEENLKGTEYNVETGYLFKADHKTILVYEFVEPKN
jgi:hypothetical protein